MVNGVKVQRVIDQANTVIEPGKKISMWKFHHITGHTGEHLLRPTAKYMKIELTGKLAPLLMKPMQRCQIMNKLISVNYWFGCDWWFCEVGYLGWHASQLSLTCAVVYLWNTGYIQVTRPGMETRIQYTPAAQVGKRQVSWVGWWGWRVEIYKTHATVVNGGMQFCEVISFVEFARGPNN